MLYMLAYLYISARAHICTFLYLYVQRNKNYTIHNRTERPYIVQNITNLFLHLYTTNLSTLCTSCIRGITALCILFYIKEDLLLKLAVYHSSVYKIISYIQCITLQEDHTSNIHTMYTVRCMYVPTMYTIRCMYVHTMYSII